MLLVVGVTYVEIKRKYEDCKLWVRGCAQILSFDVIGKLDGFPRLVSHKIIYPSTAPMRDPSPSEAIILDQGSSYWKTAGVWGACPVTKSAKTRNAR
jgi:hypothetical protein